jgi:aspartate ammonia-lyase
MRTEKDLIGILKIDDNALYGIHSLRAKLNFPDNTPFQLEWYKAIGLTKLACYLTYKDFKTSVLSKYGSRIPFKLIEDEVIDVLIQSASEVSEGKYFEYFIVPAVCGGAGTSLNMNVNEIITNSVLKKLNYKPGDYHIIDPIEQANIYQSTNDVIPTSLKVAVMRLLNKLEENINNLRAGIEKIEKDQHNNLRIAYTQMQEAVPNSWGKLFSTYNDALSRDWWRVSKCFERIKVVNLGGSAVGTGITVPRFFIMEVVQKLQHITGLPVTRSENMADATSNHDSLVEVHAILKAHAVNLEKMANDIRLLASDISHKELSIPSKQAGSSIMPGKINPVIPEYAISIAHKVYANDSLISGLAAQGCLDLNAYLPVIGNALLDSLNLLIAADDSLLKNMIEGLKVNSEISMQRLLHSPGITTALIPYIGYHKATTLAKTMKEDNISIFEANEKVQIIDKDKLSNILEPSFLLKEGFSITDIIDNYE